MRFMLAIKAFFKALKDPSSAEHFLEDKKLIPEPTKVEADLSHLRLLSMLQHSSRIIDFLKEDISSYDDAQIGAAVRKIHEDSGKCLEELVTIRPVIDQNEGTKYHVPQGYDSTKIKVVGNVKGEPPYSGVLVHAGWKAHKRSLPKNVSEQTGEVICPAEIEIRN